MATEDRNQPNWERGVIEKLASDALKEQKRARRWNNFFKLFIVGYMLLLLALYLPTDLDVSSSEGGEGHTAVISIDGVIAADAEASADNIIEGLRDAYDDDQTKGIVLRINSPGGSPVQAGYVNDEINRLRKLNPDIPVYAVISDLCASGGYYIAAAADEIYADKASLVGSIGVLMSGFGFPKTLDKLGVERRLITAGSHKGFMDPFSPVNDVEVEHVKTMLATLHKQFIKVVKEGRGDRLKDNENLFSGYIWTGEESVEMGLTDGIGSTSYVARELIEAENTVSFTHKKDWTERFAERLGVGAAKVLSSTLGLQSQGVMLR